MLDTGAIERALEQLGAPRLLVNCAGIGVAKRMLGRDGPMALEELERVIRVNLLGTFNVTRLVTHAMSLQEPWPAANEAWLS